MNSKLKEAIDLAAKDAQILRNPSSQLYPVLMDKIRHLNIVGERESEEIDTKVQVQNAQKPVASTPSEKTSRIRPSRTPKSTAKAITPNKRVNQEFTRESERPFNKPKTPLTKQDLTMKFYQARPISGRFYDSNWRQKTRRIIEIFRLIL
jgi:hypothetical protein